MTIRLGILLVALGITACGGEPEPPTAGPGAVETRETRVSIAPPVLAPDVRARLDEGNTAFENGEYEAARRSFEAAVAADTMAVAAWFGLYMTFVELGEPERAREVSARLEAMARPPLGDPHATDADEGSGMVEQPSQLEGGT